MQLMLHLISALYHNSLLLLHVANCACCVGGKRVRFMFFVVDVLHHNYIVLLYHTCSTLVYFAHCVGGGWMSFVFRLLAVYAITTVCCCCTHIIKLTESCPILTTVVNAYDNNYLGC